ncbi:hypothetical protein ACOQNH_01105 [Acinetobacter baumannii]|uniref:hypothetical protein n=1 Tax=Acinetobacter baumannii TaxID=470 RepID=UPI0004530148|nr:hypothetical protein [Acinetobacter baumannii]EXI37837.1 hypothetical protein J647_2378 [Acinetobacter baumannii 846928]MDC4523277.1 hypothetical protein [Acinetobacter baumannii]MDC4645045.1 hypothetical protein [Acinetobacter baumannii]MDC4725482.1 hypothetical protein [Acinetobacter baumannii]MDC5016758.1 hypothetical protein [Acinetobacter baumannii]
MNSKKEEALVIWFKKPSLENLNSILESSEDDKEINYFVFNIITKLFREEKALLNGFLSFNYFYSISGAKEAQLEKFIEAVYVLVRYPFSLLIQKFRIFDDSRQQWVVIDNQTIEQAYNLNEFFNPLTGKEISKNQFNQLITPYFELSEKGKAVFNVSNQTKEEE